MGHIWNYELARSCSLLELLLYRKLSQPINKDNPDISFPHTPLWMYFCWILFPSFFGKLDSILFVFGKLNMRCWHDDAVFLGSVPNWVWRVLQERHSNFQFLTHFQISIFRMKTLMEMQTSVIPLLWLLTVVVEHSLNCLDPLFKCEHFGWGQESLNVNICCLDLLVPTHLALTSASFKVIPQQ